MLSFVLGTLLCLASGAADSALRATPADPAHPTRALIVSIDGLRPDVLLRADAPAIRGLMRDGSFTMWAETVPVAITLPAHTSMLTGVDPGKHGVVWNTDRPMSPSLLPRRPTLFQVARQAGFTTALVAGKAKFKALLAPGTLDWSSVPDTGSRPDPAVTDTAIAWLTAHSPQVLFVHLPQVDLAGHKYGWGTPEQLAAVATADRCVGRLLAALGDARDSTVVLITADHGGAGKTHGAGDPRSLHIPWIIAGPGIRSGFDLTTIPSLKVRTEDTFATICHVLGIPLHDPIDGRPVLQALDQTRTATR